MADFDAWEFEHWCREVLPELATFQAACAYKTRKTAGAKLDKEGQSVGRSITRLELLLKDWLGGGSLLDPKEQRKVEPTDAGRALLEYSEKVASERALLLKKLTSVQSGSEIRVAMTHYAWLAYHTDLEVAYKERRPDGVLNFGDKLYAQDKVWKDIEREVVEGRADIGIYSFPPSRQKEFPAELSLLNWMEEEIVLVLPKGLAKQVRRDRISVRELSEIFRPLPRVVHYSRPLGFDRTDAIYDYLRRQRVLERFEDDWLLGVNSISEIKDTLLHKGGISFLPWPTVEKEHAKGLLTAYRLDSDMRPRVIKIISRVHNCRGAVQDFLAAAETLRGVKNFHVPRSS